MTVGRRQAVRHRGPAALFNRNTGEYDGPERFFFEPVGDWQLARFKADPANEGKVMRGGLWRYTRHPNYFGGATVSWGLFIIAAATPWGWTTVFAPVIMTALLLRVSGVALLERTITRRRPEYADLHRDHQPFTPWPPKRRPS